MKPSLPFLNLFVLRSSDIHQAVKFYEILGLTFSLHAHGTGPEHYSAEMAGLVFEIYPATEKSGPSTGARIGFRVKGLDSLLPRLEESGAKTVSPPKDSEWGRRAVIKDLDGHVVEFLEQSN